MIRIPVALPSSHYDIRIEPGGLDQLGAALLDLGKADRVLVVSNPTILKHYGARVQRSLLQAGFESASLALPAGERYKTLRTVERIYQAALDCRLERSSIIVALGGGVIGDMTGFAASTWLRGVRVVQVPTTLLAMVDAAIGGKTGVNHPQGKNLIGTFYQPSLVLVDPDVLATLPRRERRSAMAEVIKYGVIWDAELFRWLETLSDLDRLEPAQLTRILVRSCQTKAEVVVRDEREGGLRAILNYGHTVGHAIESVTNYRRYLHGEGVALGMVAAGRLAANLGLWSASEAARQEALIAGAHLPVRWAGDIATDALIERMQTDKKVVTGRVRFVLPEAIGRASIGVEVPEAVLRSVLDSLAD
ncbi:3-dehydroquinate synthase [Gloeobacter kilaueensis]|uniref:3-dehydroquinate synthase n=1 Tax=Gloeobacter kilaueensis (strain ATCC BAA-2537 / CCAP 1431/1 / ULC 316 / JS1) TaxID=1183438 RepID=U5QNE5_GLOK1|nr:3-dehydroquinate synthase [Gloeobacter kilaueensis]AGY59200.1 3-dehydroquinate synthase [Gloeobacter kilaueensis JS1]